MPRGWRFNIFSVLCFSTAIVSSGFLSRVFVDGLKEKEDARQP